MLKYSLYYIFCRHQIPLMCTKTFLNCYKRLVIIVGYDVSCQMRLGSFSHAITKAKIDCASQQICPYHQVVWWHYNWRLTSPQ